MLKQRFKFNSNKINYITMYLLLAYTAMPYFYMYKPFLLVFTLILFIFFIVKKRKFDQFLFIYLLVLVIVQTGQAVVFAELPIRTFIGYALRVLFAYFAIKLIGKNFPDYYVNLIYFFSIISLVFFFAIITIPGFKEYLVYNLAPALDFTANYFDNLPFRPQKNIIVFCLDTWQSDFFRNSGPFWESGAFGGFLAIALLFNFIKHKKLFDKKNFVFYITIITTFSTTAYILLFLFFLSFAMFKKNKLQGLAIIAFISVISFYVFVNVSFLYNKITDQIYRTTMDRTGEDLGITRFTSALLDLHSALDYPIFGTGTSFEALGKGDLDSWGYYRHRNNGIFYLLAVYGFPIFFIYFYLVYHSFKNYCLFCNFNKKYAYICLILVLVAGFSEVYFLLVFFISLTMLGFIYRPYTSIFLNKARKN